MAGGESAGLRAPVREGSEETMKTVAEISREMVDRVALETGITPEGTGEMAGARP